MFRAPPQTNQDSNVYELRQLFPQVDQQTLQQVYHQVGRNFELAYKRLDQMIRYNTERNAMASVTPERKLTFLRLAFDKLNPNLIQSILQHWNWSVEGAIDDILKAEEERDRQEQAIRKAEEEERRRREMERLQQLEEQRKAMEKQNQVLFFVSMFPAIPQHYIVQTLEHNKWNGDATFPVLEAADHARRQQELAQKRQEEAHRQQEEERRRMEEMARFEEDAKKMIDNKLPDLLQCQNWDQISKLVEEPAQPIPKPGQAPLDAKHAAMVKVAASLNPKLSPAVVAKIFADNSWDAERSLVMAHAKSFQDAFERLVATFPTIPREELHSTLHKYFPAEGDAMKDLQPIANEIAEEKHLLDALKHAEELLDEAKKQWSNWDAEKKDMLRKRAERRAQLASATSDEERQFITIVDEMQTQKETITIETNEPKYQQELNKRLARVQEIRSQLEVLQMRRKQRIDAQVRTPSTAVSARDLLAQYQTLLQHELKQLEALQQSKDTDKMSIVAKRLREKIGEGKFAELQGAIGRAPAGAFVVEGDAAAIKRASMYSAPGVIITDASKSSSRPVSAVLTPSNPSARVDAPAPVASTAPIVPQMATGPLNPSPSSSAQTSPRGGYTGFNPFVDLPGVPDGQPAPSAPAATLAQPMAPASSVPVAPEHVPVPSFGPLSSPQLTTPGNPNAGSTLGAKMNLAPHSSFQQGATKMAQQPTMQQPVQQQHQIPQMHPMPMQPMMQPPSTMAASGNVQQFPGYYPNYSGAYGMPMQNSQSMQGQRPMYASQPFYPNNASQQMPGGYQPIVHNNNYQTGYQQPMYQQQQQQPQQQMYYSNGYHNVQQQQPMNSYPVNAQPLSQSAQYQQQQQQQPQQQPRTGYPGSYGQKK